MADPKSVRGSDEEFDRVMKILEANAHLDFVQRILNPEKHPQLTSKDDDRLKPGEEASHQMSWGQNGPDETATEFYVYPNIINEGSYLTWLEPDEAHKYAVESDERIVFDNKKDAEWFSKAYKLIWPEKPHQAERRAP